MLVALVMCVCPVLAQVPREMPTAVEQHFIPRSRERDGKSDPRVGLSRELVPDLRPLVTKTLVPASLIETISRIASRSKNLLNYLNAARDVFAPNEGQSLVWANNEIKVFGETAGSLRKSISQNHKLAASRVEANKLLQIGDEPRRVCALKGAGQAHAGGVGKNSSGPESGRAQLRLSPKSFLLFPVTTVKRSARNGG
jgi:hypothetical protein